jgi:hypothetical protein
LTVEYRILGNHGLEQAAETLVSHASHRGIEKGCEEVVVCVKKVSRWAQVKGFERAGNAQGEKGWQSFWKQVNQVIHART